MRIRQHEWAPQVIVEDDGLELRVTNDGGVSLALDGHRGHTWFLNETGRLSVISDHAARDEAPEPLDDDYGVAMATVADELKGGLDEQDGHQSRVVGLCVSAIRSSFGLE